MELFQANKKRMVLFIRLNELILFLQTRYQNSCPIAEQMRAFLGTIPLFLRSRSYQLGVCSSGGCVAPHLACLFSPVMAVFLVATIRSTVISKEKY